MPRLNLYLTDAEHHSIHDAAKSARQSMNSWCITALLRAIEGTTPITANLSQGEVVIIQKRAEKGRFAKRSE